MKRWNVDTLTHKGECYVKMKAEIGVILSSQGTPKMYQQTTSSWERSLEQRSLLHGIRRSPPFWHLGFGPWASGTMRVNFYCLSHLVCHICFCQAWDADGLPWWLRGKESTCQCRRLKFNPWSGKIPWRKKWQPTPGFLPENTHGQRSLAGYSPRGSKDWATTTTRTLSAVFPRNQCADRCITFLSQWTLRATHIWCAVFST